MILELTEVMTYALSEAVPFYRYMLTSNERKVWTEGGRSINARTFGRTWAAKQWCQKQNKEIPMNGVATTDDDRRAGRELRVGCVSVDVAADGQRLERRQRNLEDGVSCAIADPRHPMREHDEDERDRGPARDAQL